jgi:hypothetical protein
MNSQDERLVVVEAIGLPMQSWGLSLRTQLERAEELSAHASLVGTVPWLHSSKSV